MIWEQEDWVWKIDSISLNEILYHNLKAAISSVFCLKKPIPTDLRGSFRKACVDIVSYVNYFNKKIDEKYRGDNKHLKLLAFNLGRELTQIDFFEKIEPFPDIFFNEEGHPVERDYIFEKVVRSGDFEVYIKDGVAYETLRYFPEKYLVIDLIRQYIRFSILRYIAYNDERESILNNEPKWNYKDHKRYDLNFRSASVQTATEDIENVHRLEGIEYSKLEIKEISRLLYLGANTILNYTNNKKEIEKFIYPYRPIFDYLKGKSRYNPESSIHINIFSLINMFNSILKLLNS